MSYVRVEAEIPMRADLYFEVMQQAAYDEFAAEVADNLDKAREDERCVIPTAEYKHYVPPHHTQYCADEGEEAAQFVGSHAGQPFLTPQRAGNVVQRRVSLLVRNSLPWAVRRVLGLNDLWVHETRTYLRHRMADLPPRESRSDHPIYTVLASMPGSADEVQHSAAQHSTGADEMTQSQSQSPSSSPHEFYEILFVSKPPILQDQLSCYGSLYLLPSGPDSCRLVNICYPQSHVPGFSALLLQIFSREIKHAYSLVPTTVGAWKSAHPHHDLSSLASSSSSSSSSLSSSPSPLSHAHAHVHAHSHSHSHAHARTQSLSHTHPDALANITASHQPPPAAKL